MGELRRFTLLKRFGTLGLISVAALALAQGVVLMGAQGRGMALSEDHRRAEFRVDVRKLTSEPPRLGGNFNVAINGPDARPVQIELRELRGLQVGGEHRNVCEFGGPAVMTVRTPSGLQRFQGMLHVRAADNDTHGDHDRPDTLALEFTRPDSDDSYRFAGAVRDGNINVYIRNP